VVGGSIAGPSRAEAIPSCVNAGNVTGLGAAGCDLGTLNFSDFMVSATGVTANIFLGGLSAVVANNVNLTFQVAHSPSPANLSDILFSYTVKTLSGQPELGGVDLYNAGKNVTIWESICGPGFDNGVCPTGTLADYVATGGSIASATFSPLSTIYVLKDIQLLQDAFISEFTNSHDEPPLPAPEPTTLLLVGSSLAAAGVALRKRRAYRG
jgi:PEP-CTERM motif